MRTDRAPIVVIGGGFYGCSIATFLSEQGAHVVLIEREKHLLDRASYHNQARLHGGYHYPRSFSTAYRSRLNFPRFVDEFYPAVESSFTKLYAIARHNSKVDARQFVTFCSNIDAPVRRARQKYLTLFSDNLIESVFEVDEYAFDAVILRKILERRLKDAGAVIRRGHGVAEVKKNADENFDVILDDGSGQKASFVLNCTYSGLNRIKGIPRTRHLLKHEITEMALIELPPALEGISVTVMDGPFFSFMPFPSLGLNTFSHVRYTPRTSWMDTQSNVSPYEILADYPRDTAFGFMVRDAARFLPDLAGSRYRDSLFEVKTVLVQNEADDGRPILFEYDEEEPRIISILGSKIDNIYDILISLKEHLDA